MRHVGAGGSVEVANILDLLTSLVDKSLTLAETQHGEARCRLLETVRQYARERLREPGEDAQVRTRHRTWCLALAEQAEAKIRGPCQRIWMERFGVEHDNLRAALVWSREDPRGAEAGVRIVFALGWFWFLRGYWSEASAWLEEALNHWRDAPRGILARLYGAAAHYAYQFGNFECAQMLGEEGLAIARDLSDKWSSAFLLVQLGGGDAPLQRGR